ncbi:MAG: InlB B-repeat-containing protein, partial [Tidjanibacter sp.]|nr:InlB B-repeat-containing protein [Tidjanibacter sp.]
MRIKAVIISILVLLCVGNLRAESGALGLVPMPRKVELTEGEFCYHPTATLYTPDMTLRGYLADYFAVGRTIDFNTAVMVGINPRLDLPAEGYVLEVRPEGVVVSGVDYAGAFNGVQTLLQLFDGYGWSNWSGKWTYDNGEYGISNRTLQLYPIWQAKTYTIKYSCGNTTTQTVTYNTSVTMAANTCTKKGYTHIGWTTNSSGADDGHGWSNWSGTWAYDNGQYGISGNILQLYPRWQAKTYTVKYSCGSGTGSVSNHIATFDTNFTIKTSGCTKNGYAFVGWTTNSNESNDGYNWTNWSGKWVYDDGQYGITNRTLQFYPMWNQCPAGSYSNGATCTKCPDGTYSNAGAASCTDCPVGSYCSGGNKYSCPTCYPDRLPRWPRCTTAQRGKNPSSFSKIPKSPPRSAPKTAP